MPITSLFAWLIGVGGHADELVGHLVIDDTATLPGCLRNKAAIELSPAFRSTNVVDFVSTHVFTLATNLPVKQRRALEFSSALLRCFVDYALRSKRSAFMTLTQAETKSLTNFSLESS